MTTGRDMVLRIGAWVTFILGAVIGLSSAASGYRGNVEACGIAVATACVYLAVSCVLFRVVNKDE